MVKYWDLMIGSRVKIKKTSTQDTSYYQVRYLPSWSLNNHEFSVIHFILLISIFSSVKSGFRVYGSEYLQRDHFSYIKAVKSVYLIFI